MNPPPAPSPELSAAASPDGPWSGDAGGGLRNPVTQLATRALFLDRVRHSILRRRRRQTLFAVLHVSLDRLREIGAAGGRATTAELLVAAARRLEGAVRETDTISHPGGDGFAVLLDDLTGPGDAARVAERIQRALEAPFSVGGTEISTPARIGIAVMGDSYTRPQDLLRDAYTAMRSVAGDGRVRFRVFDPSMHVVEAPRLDGELRGALERRELRVLFEPVVSLADGRLAGMEAVLCWEHPERGPLAPEHFAAAAEDAGLAVNLGRYLLGEACRRFRGWQYRHPSAAAATLHVDPSRVRLRWSDLAPETEEALRISALPPRALVLHLPEAAVMEAGKPALDVLNALKAQRVRLCLSEFGMGYFGLGHLHRFPLDALRIDRSFVRGLGIYDENTAIVRTIVALAASMGLRTHAEAVEEDEQADLLRSLGCGLAQGPRFSPPLDPITAETFLSARNADGSLR